MRAAVLTDDDTFDAVELPDPTPRPGELAAVLDVDGGAVAKL
jgi:hypothetical protein